MFANPESNVRQFGLTPNMHVADLGAGSGAYTTALAEILTNGKVYAVEVQKELLTRIKSEAEKRHLTNIEVVWGDIERAGGTKLGNNSMEGVLASNVLFQVEDKKGFLQEIYRILKPGGFLYLIDWADSYGGMGPTSDSVMSKDKARTFVESGNFTYDHDFNPGAHHYGMIFKRK